MKLINTLRKNKYKNIVFNKKEEILYIGQKKEFYKDLLKKDYKRKEKKNKIKKDNIEYVLIKLLNKKKLNNLDKTYLLTLRKKYEANLQLKEKYGSNLVKLTNKKANIDSTIVLIACFIKFKLMNEISTFNLCLKVIDDLIINFYLEKKTINNWFLTKKIIEYEKKKFKLFYYSK